MKISRYNRNMFLAELVLVLFALFLIVTGK